MRNANAKLPLISLVVALVAFCGLCQSNAEDGPSSSSAGQRPDAGNLRAFVELARSDIKIQKSIIIAENLPMAEEEAAEFWPLHREYETDLAKLNDQKLALIVRYANQYETMTDKAAGELVKSSFDLEAKKLELKRKYFKRFSKVMSATKVARFFQLENQLNMVLDLQVAASMPLIK